VSRAEFVKLEPLGTSVPLPVLEKSGTKVLVGAGTEVVRACKRVKAMWRRHGKGKSLREWVAGQADQDPDAALWLAHKGKR